MEYIITWGDGERISTFSKGFAEYKFANLMDQRIEFTLTVIDRNVTNIK